MKYSVNEVLQFVAEEDVKFIRLAFCDVFGGHKNISVMPSELKRAFTYGVAIDASSIGGFGDEVHSDLFLHPDPDTLSILPWRPEHGRVVRMYCNVTYPDGTPFENDTRRILKNAVKYAKDMGVEFFFGSEMEFYLFNLDESGNRTYIPHDKAGYMDIAPEDKGENVRREICLTLEQMGIYPEASHHEQGPGQNEIDFKYSDPLTAADDAVTFRSVVKTVASRNGLFADFSPKPIDGCAGSGFHINVSAVGKSDYHDKIIAGILQRIEEITLFLNPTEASYRRLGCCSAPKFITWSYGNRSQLIRVPETADGSKRLELRSPDVQANPYLAFALIIYAGCQGIKNDLTLEQPVDLNLFKLSDEQAKNYKTLPVSFNKACHAALESQFVNELIPKAIIDCYVNRK